jgi:hypothetical protein
MSNRNIPWLLMPINRIRPDLKERSFLEDFEMPVILPESHYLPMIPCCLKVLRFVHPNVDLAWLSHAFDLDHDQVASICPMIVSVECVGPCRGVPVEAEMERDQEALDLRSTAAMRMPCFSARSWAMAAPVFQRNFISDRLNGA